MRNRGFTLLELSIVLLIIGLISGSILAGATLLRSGHIRSVISQVSSTVSAINTFQVKYAYLPGDLPTATSYWPAGSQYSGFTTYNGNGDGKICVECAAFATYPNTNERFVVWQHLGLAGMIKGSFAGHGTDATYANTGNWLTPGVSVPETAIPTVGIDVFWHSTAAAITTQQLNALHVAAQLSTSLDNPAFTPTETAMIDGKLDDGMPYTGKLIGNNVSTTTGCIVGSGATATYAIVDKTNLCGFDLLLF